MSFEFHTMPNGTTCVYRESDHSYWREANGDSGKGRLTGVSTVVAPYDWNPDGLMKWACRLNHDGIATLASLGLSQEEPDDMRAELDWLLTGERITDTLAAHDLDHTSQKEKRGREGTNVHQHALHALATGQELPSYDKLTDEELGYAEGILRFWRENQPVTLCSEVVVFSDALGIAGRFDWSGGLNAGDFKGSFALLDAKTSGYLSTKFHVQIEGYRKCSADAGFKPTDLGLILQVKPDGMYDLIPSCATEQSFLNAVNVYRDAARIGREQNAARKTSAALRQAA